MRITVISGTGEGPTALGAFDAALLAAGVANYNLIPLSSIIPRGAVVERAAHSARLEEWGHRLYVVLARHDEHELGNAAWAGLGWVQDRETGRGLFVEQHGPSEDAVIQAIEATLKSMTANRKQSFGPIQIQTIGIESHGQHVCALVLAVYKSEDWA